MTIEHLHDLPVHRQDELIEATHSRRLAKLLHAKGLITDDEMEELSHPPHDLVIEVLAESNLMQD